MLHLFLWFFSTGTNEKVEVGNRPVDICCDGDLLLCIKRKSSIQVSWIHVSFPSCSMAATHGSFPKTPSFLIPQFILHLPSFYIIGRDWVSTSADSTWMYIVTSLLCIYFQLHWIFHCCMQAFSSCGEQGLHSSCGVQASHWSFFCCRAQALECMGFSSRSTQAYLLCGTWNLPGPGIKPCISRQILIHCATRETLLF